MATGFSQPYSSKFGLFLSFVKKDVQSFPLHFIPFKHFFICFDLNGSNLRFWRYGEVQDGGCEESMT